MSVLTLVEPVEGRQGGSQDCRSFVLFFTTLSAYYVVQARLEKQLHERAASVKTCPDCAAEVKAEAHVCRYCGFRFSEVELTKSQR